MPPQSAAQPIELTENHRPFMTPPPSATFQEDIAAADISIWKEALFATDILLLHASPVYYGLGVPYGDGSGVILVPGFLGSDNYLRQMYTWLARVGYKPYFSGIGFNADCPNLIINRRLNECIDRAVGETGKKIHLIGHSLGGIIARSLAGQRASDVASVITLGSPFRGTVVHRTLVQAAEVVRKRILKQNGATVLPACYTGHCTCDFLCSLRREISGSIMQTAIYTRSDGIADWRYCTTGDCDNDFAVAGTHIGLAFNAAAYGIIATRLAMVSQSARVPTAKVIPLQAKS